MHNKTAVIEMEQPARPGAPKAILIVDDNAAVANMIMMSLRRLGHVNVGIACGGVEALAVVERTHPDIVIIDINMPGIDGIETAQRLTLNHPCAIIFSTGLWDKDTVERSRKIPCSSYLVKPFSPAQLQAAIHLVN